jgi:para-nitrobenzyl esterase
MAMLLLLLLLLQTSVAAAASSSPAVVITPDGTLRCSLVGRGTRQCLAVPFAAPPTGHLRWRPPAAPTPWAGVRDATRPAPTCVQPSGSGSEDCLYADVYSPSTPAPSTGGGWPVIVYVHGGTYTTGSAGSLNATAFVERSRARSSGVVVVVIQYRLNVFGFMGSDEMRALDPERSTGNTGLQDQRAAFAWVRRSIEAFGGNPRSVTIDGCSAGAGSTANHLVNAKSWPYFDRASGQSGMFAIWITNSFKHATGVYGRVLSAAGCADLGCLQSKNTSELVAAANTGAAAPRPPGPRVWGGDGNTWGPVVDGIDVIGMPAALAATGHLHPTAPVLLGTARDEGGTFAHEAGNLSKGEWETWAHATYPTADVEQLTQLYSGHPATVGSDRWSKEVHHGEWWWAAAKADGDRSFHCPAREGARWLSAHGNRAYLFSFEPAKRWQTDVIGHCSEKAYAYDTYAATGVLGLAMADAWASFAQHGDPNSAAVATVEHGKVAERAAQQPTIGVASEGELASGGGGGVAAPEWPPWTNASDVFMAWGRGDGGRGATVATGLRASQCDYWRLVG